MLENLYATLIALVWPLLYLELPKHGWESEPVLAVLYIFVFLCDDYYTSHKALGGLTATNRWRDACRFWLDITILALLFGCSIEVFRTPVIVYLIAVVYLLCGWWCGLLQKDYDEFAATAPESVYVRHLIRQQKIYCFCLSMYVLGSIGANIWHLIVVDGTIASFDWSKLNWDVIVPLMDVKILAVLWMFLLSQILLRVITLLIIDGRCRFLGRCAGVGAAILRKPWLEVISGWLVRWVRRHKQLLFFIGAFGFALVSRRLRVEVLIGIILLWFLRELLSGEGLLWEAAVAEAVTEQSRGLIPARDSALAFLAQPDKEEKGETKGS